MLPIAPWARLLGLTLVMTGVPAVTVKALFSDAVSPPEVMVAVRAPGVAAGSMAMLGVACVASVTLRVDVVMPWPRLKTEVPCRKFVPEPTIDKVPMFWPCWPVLGETLAIVAEPEETVELVDTVSPPVVRLTVRLPVPVVPGMDILTVASVASVTVTLATVMPEAKFAVVVPWMKWVKAAAMVPFRLV